MRRRTLSTIALALFAFGAAALVSCSGDSSGGGESQQVDSCGPGQTPGPNGCIRDRDDDDDGEMDATTIPDSNPTDTGTQTTDTSADGAETSTNSDCPGGCPSDEFCLDGECRQGSKCDAGEKLGCVGGHTLRVCTDKGVGFREKECPEDKPNCVSFKKDGCDENLPKCFEPKCTDKVCDPETKFCKDKVTLMQCSSDGTSSSQVKLCRGRCKDGRCVSACQGNAKSYVGCGFYAVDLDNFSISCQSGGFIDACTASGQGQCKNNICTDGNANDQQFGVTVSNTTRGPVDVEVFDGEGNKVKSATVQADNLKVLDLPRQDTVDSSLSDNSYRISATGAITVHQFNPKNQSGVFTNDASLLLPSNALGRKYTVVGWPSLADQSTSSLTPHQRGYVTVVAVKKGTTTVDVETPAKIISGNGVNQISAGGTDTFQLRKGEVLQLMTEQKEGSDLTGMTIDADNNVAVFSGHECANVPLDTPFCDHLEQQLYPTSTWGKQYVLSKFAPRGDEDDLFRIVAAQDGTTIQTKPPIQNIDGEKLDAGEVLEFKFRDNLIVKGDKPITIAQFMVGSAYPGPDEGCDPRGDTSNCKVTDKCQSGNKQTRIGDPAFLLNVPRTQFRKDYVVQTPKGYQEDWLNIVAEQGATVKVDGSEITSSGSQIGSTSWRVIRKQVEPGVHRVKADSAVGLYSYGYECDVSYAYPGGLDLSTNSRKP